jgi:hypothetical protein
MQTPISFSVWTSVGSFVATTFLSTFPWVALFILSSAVFGIRQYTITDNETGRRIQRRLLRSSETTENGKATGWSFGRWFILHLSQHRYGSEIETRVWIVATKASFLKLTEQEIVETGPGSGSSSDTGAGAGAAGVETGATESVETRSHLTILQRTGTFYNVDYTRRSIRVGYIPRPQQQVIMTKIQTRMQATGHCVAFLHGAPGTGKSLVGLMLANSMKATYCNNLRLWQPGDTLARLHAEACPSQESPLVVLLDEIDVALVAIHAGITPHKNIPIPVGDKQGWNSLMDDFSHGMYPWTVLVLTANRGPDFVRGLDPSYIRPGRVDIIEEVA